MASFTQYLRETQAEFKHVNWPTQSQAVAFTVLVIVISLVVSLILFAFDTGFIALLQEFII